MCVPLLTHMRSQKGKDDSTIVSTRSDEMSRFIRFSSFVESIWTNQIRTIAALKRLTYSAKSIMVVNTMVSPPLSKVFWQTQVRTLTVLKRLTYSTKRRKLSIPPNCNIFIFSDS